MGVVEKGQEENSYNWAYSISIILMCVMLFIFQHISVSDISMLFNNASGIIFPVAHFKTVNLLYVYICLLFICGTCVFLYMEERST